MSRSSRLILVDERGLVRAEMDGSGPDGGKGHGDLGSAAAGASP